MKRVHQVDVRIVEDQVGVCSAAGHRLGTAAVPDNEVRSLQPCALAMVPTRWVALGGVTAILLKRASTPALVCGRAARARAIII